MSEIRSILLHFTKLSDLTQENLQLAKKTALLELKFSNSDSISIDKQNYSKEALIQVFDYYLDQSNLELFESIEKLEELYFIKNPQKIDRFSSYKIEFNERDDYFNIQTFISEHFFENYFKELKTTYRTKQFLKYVRMRGQISYLYYFKPSFQDKVKTFFKNSLLVEFETMRRNKFVLEFNSDYKKHFLFSTSFIQFCGDIGNDDQDFLHEVLDVTHDFYNSYLKMTYLVVTCFKEHKKLNHSLENQLNLDENIKQLDTENTPEAKKDFAWKYFAYMAIMLIFVLKMSRTCTSYDDKRNRDVQLNIESLKKHIYSNGFSDTISQDSSLIEKELPINPN